MTKERCAVAGLTPFVLEGYVSFPLAPAVLISYVRQHRDIADHFELHALDFQGHQSDGEIVDALLVQPPRLLGWSCYIWNIHRVIRISKLIKERSPGTTIMLGGPHVSGEADAAALLREHPYIDIVVRGEGEIVLTNYLRHLADPANHPPGDGLTLRNAAGEVHETGPRLNLPTLMDVPSPYLDGTITFDPTKRYTVNMQTYRGCPFACRFCAWGEAIVRKYSLETLLKEIDFIFSHDNIDGCFIFDADFFMFKDRAIAILEAIRARAPNINLFVEGAPNTITQQALALINTMPNVYISFGLQSVDPEVRKLAKRHENLAKYRATVTHIRTVAPNIKINIGLIYGLPLEKYDGYMDALEFVLSLDVPSVTLNYFEILPGTEFYRDADRYQIKHTGAPYYTVISTPTFSQDDFARAVEFSSFIGVCFNLPYLRESLVRLARLVHGQPRPHVHVFEEMFARLHAAIAPDGAAPMAICRDTEDNLKRAAQYARLSEQRNCVAIYAVFLELARRTLAHRADGASPDDHDPALLDDMRVRIAVIEEFVRGVTERVAPEVRLTQVMPWTLPQSGVSTKPLLPGGQAYF